MITNTTAKITYTFTEGITEYAVGFVYQTNPDGSPQIKVYINDAVNTPLVYGTDYTMSLDGTKVVIASGAEVGDSLTIIRNIPIVQLSDYVVGRIDPEQIENDFDLCVERDQQQSARITVTEEQLAAHDERISDIEEVVPESATTDNLLATVSDIPTDLAQLTNSPGYITGITSSDVTTALGYTPYDASNPDGYTTNTGTVTSVNNVQPVNGNVTLEFPTAEQSDWAQSDNTKVDYIKNKPTLGTAAAADTTDFATATQGGKADTAVQPSDLATVATSGSYSDLLNKPTIPTVNNATITITQGGVTKGSFSLNQTSGETIALDAGGSGGGAVDSVNGQTGVVVLTASDVGALPDSTVIPDAQIQSDWNQSDNTKVDYIKNKPSIPAAQVNADWNAVSGVAQILNKPTIPTVNDSTITITQGGVTKGTFTTNQGSAGTIALDAGGTTTGQSIDAEIVGSPTINNDSVVGNLSSLNYLTLPGQFDMTGANDFQIVMAFATADVGSRPQQVIFCENHGPAPKIRIQVSDSKLQLYLYNEATQTAQTLTGSTTLSSKTKYYVMVAYNGTDYVLSLSTDGITYNQEATAVAQFVPGHSNYGYIIGSYSPYAPMVFEVYLDGCYIKKNGVLVWQGMDAPGLHHKANTDLSNIPANIDYVVESQLPTAQNNYTWYRKYKSGWVEQGGLVNNGSATTTWSAAVVFPIEMSDTNYSYQITPKLESFSTSGNAMGTVYQNTTTGFTVRIDSKYSNAGNTQWASWQVSGMAAN